MTWLPRSLRGRIALATTLLVALLLTGLGVMLSRGLERFVDQSYLARLEGTAVGLLAAIEFDEDDDLRLLRDVGEPAFGRVRSGWYWQIADPDEVLLTSRSLWLDVLETPPADVTVAHDWPGPQGERLFAYVHRGFAPGIDQPLTIIVTAPETEIEAQWQSIARPLWAGLALLALALIVGAVAAVQYMVRPLKALRHALERVRRGEASRVEAPIPDELRPLIDELHHLLDHTDALVTRSRHHLADLAHALKTPLAVIRNEVEALPESRRSVIEPALAQLERLVEGHLKRARAAGAHQVLGQRTQVAAVVAPFADWVAHLRATHPVDWRQSVPDDLFFAGEHADLEEMLGNLIENAAKWTRRTIEVRAWREDRRLMLVVEDDGPGMDDDALSAALDRGVRFDETTEGTGLGLSIVRDVAALYGGHLSLTNRAPRGLSARLELPAA